MVSEFAKYRVLLCITTLLMGSGTSEKSVAQPRWVEAVIDGEHVILSDGARVELLGIDVIPSRPSRERNRKAIESGLDPDALEQQGDIATAYLTALVRSRYVLVNFQDGGVHARSGNAFRPAFVFVLDPVGRVEFEVNERMVEDGYAIADVEADAGLRKRFEALQVRAKIEKKGLWGGYGAVEEGGVEAEARDARNADLTADCSRHEGCVWVSSGGQIKAGFWKSRIGYTCPCEQQR